MSSNSHIRNASFDYARLIAVIGIIWFHTSAPYGHVGYSGLAYFLILIPVLAVPQIGRLRHMRHRAPPIFRYAATRGVRLLVPWLVASLVYGGLKTVEVAHGAAWGDEFSNTMWLTGTALHLWFLPFAFVIGLMLWPMGRWATHMTRTIRAHLCVTCMCAALMALAYWQTAELSAPLAQWVYALPAILLGTSFALTGGSFWRMLGIAALFFCMALSANWTTGLQELGIATAVLLGCQALKTKPNALSSLAARVSLSLYLIHPAVAAVVLRSHFIPDNSTIFAVIVTLGSLCIVAMCETIRTVDLSTKSLWAHGSHLPAKSP